MSADPNKPVTVHASAVTLAKRASDRKNERWFPKGRRVRLDAVVEIVWSPFPTLRLRATSLTSLLPMTGSKVTIRLPGRRPIHLGEVTSHTSSSKAGEAIGVLLDGPQRLGGRVDVVSFELVNFWKLHGAIVRHGNSASASRARLIGGGFEITIDAVPDLDKMLDRLRAEGGHAITHTCTLRRSDQRSFSTATARRVLRDLGAYLSFARGAWCQPILPRGALRRRLQWESLEFIGRQSRWSPKGVWWEPGWEIEPFEDGWEGFLSTRHHPVWSRHVSVLVGRYVEVLMPALNVETAMAIAQATLELIATIQLVEVDATYTAAQFDRPILPSEKIRILLARMSVDPEVPRRFRALRRLATQHAWLTSGTTRPDGPWAITELRNGVVHAAKLDRLLAAPLRARYEAKELAVWYLELALLWVFQASGPYRSRIVTFSPRKPATMPWTP